MIGKMNSQANLINFQPNLKFEKKFPCCFRNSFFFVLFCFVLFFPCQKKFTIFIIIISWVYSLSLIHGVGEVDIQDKDEKEDNSFDEEQLSVPEVESLPYLLLDVRDEDAYKQCHIIGGVYS